jgi:hypothetical protein
MSKRQDHMGEYRIWMGMTARCRNLAYRRYGGRDISVCERWKSFDLFLDDMGTRPSDKHQLDRINNDGDYEPSNVRWATPAEQRRNTSRNIRINWRGESLCAEEWGERLGVPGWQIRARMKLAKTRGWPTDLVMAWPWGVPIKGERLRQALACYGLVDAPILLLSDVSCTDEEAADCLLVAS